MAPVKLTGVMNKALPTHSNYQTISLSFDKPLNRYTVIHTFDALNSQFGDAIIRLKGIFDFGDGYPFIIHGVKGECYPITNQIEWEDKPFSQFSASNQNTIQISQVTILTRHYNYIMIIKDCQKYI